MDVNVKGLGNATGALPVSPAGGRTGAVNGEDFRRALDQFATGGLTGPGAKPGIADLQAGVSGAGAASLKFSSHSIDRMRSRGISFSPEDLQRIESAIAKAAQKGSRDTLVVTDSSALIVSVKNNTVVTVMDRAAMKDNVFTNIDSTVMI